jgi:hypothetical protein
MSSESGQTPANESEKIAGALEVIGTLREEFEQWLGEAQNDSKRETLENVLGHIVAMEIEYQRRRDEGLGS